MLDKVGFETLSAIIQRSDRMPDTVKGTANALLARAAGLVGKVLPSKGKRVILLPGILGNELGDGSSLPLWLYPPRLFASEGLEQLKVRPGATYDKDENFTAGINITPGPLLPEAYEPLSLWLGAHGFDVETFPFDWRLSIDRAADALFHRLNEQGAPPTQLVGHSMGCLVARRCVQKYPDLIRDGKIERAAFIAPPFRGSFVPVQAAAEQYWATNLLALLGMDHGRVRGTFCTFPGFAEMIADPTTFTESTDVLAGASWPLTNFGDLLLGRARQFAKDLRQPATQAAQDADRALMERSIVVLCTRRDTVTRATRSGANLIFEPVAHGDDTVPTASAWSEDARHHYEAFWTHSLIPAEPAVWAGITEWLAGTLDTKPGWLTRLDTMPVERPGSLVSRRTGFPALLPFPFSATELDMLGRVLGIADLERDAAPELAALAPALRSAFNEGFRRIEEESAQLSELVERLIADPLQAARRLLPFNFSQSTPSGSNAIMMMSAASGNGRLESRDPAGFAELQGTLAQLVEREASPEIELQTPAATVKPAGGESQRAVAACLRLLAPFDQEREGIGWWFEKGVELDCGADIRVRPALSGWKLATLAEPPSGKSTATVPDWCAEVLLPGSAALVWQQKLPLYVRRGIGWIWLIDPELEQITAFRVHAGRAIWMGSVRDTEASTLGPFEAP